jgi:hypothetical protein
MRRWDFNAGGFGVGKRAQAILREAALEAGGRMAHARLHASWSAPLNRLWSSFAAFATACGPQIRLRIDRREKWRLALRRFGR